MTSTNLSSADSHPDPKLQASPAVQTRSKALDLEQSVRDAYDQTSLHKRMYKQLNKGSWYHLLSFFGGSTVMLFLMFQNFPNTPTSILSGLGIGVCIGAMVFGLLGSEKNAFAEMYKSQTGLLAERKGNPSRRRYVLFRLELFKHTPRPEDLRRIITIIEANLGYSGAFYRRYRIEIILVAAFAMLASSWLGQASIWETALGGQLTLLTIMLWVIAWVFGQTWRSIRPSREAQERELLTFLHQAVIDLEG